MTVLLSASRLMYRSPIGRSGRPWRRTKLSALRDYAAAKFWQKHPCECDRGDRGDHETRGFACEWHDGDMNRDKRIAIVNRYARLLLRAEKRRA